VLFRNVTENKYTVHWKSNELFFVTFIGIQLGIDSPSFTHEQEHLVSPAHFDIRFKHFWGEGDFVPFSSGGIATGYKLDGWSFSPDRDRDFSHLHSAQTGFGAHPASYPMGTWVSFPRGKVAEA
jgi:hypothetical protein